MKHSALFACSPRRARAPAAMKADPFTGRWDLVVTPKAANARVYPDWMEVGVKDGAPAVRIQPRSGSAFYAKQFKADGTHLNVPWANGTTTWDLDVKDGKLTGTEKRDGECVRGSRRRARAAAQTQSAQGVDRPRAALQRQGPHRMGAHGPAPRPITGWRRTANC